MFDFFKKEFKSFLDAVKTLDRKTVTVFLAVAVIQTISWYFASREFFEDYLFNYFSSSKNADLYEFIYWFLSDFIVLFVFSALIIKLLFKEKLKDYGVTTGDFKSGIIFSTLFLIIMLPVIWFATSEQNFIRTYPLLSSARDSWNIFFLFEFVMFIYIFAWEFIWRGFMLFGLKPRFGYYSILIQMIPFVILHNGKPAAETFGAIAGGIALGILAYRTKSIYYCLISHAGVMFSIDLISTLRYRTNDFGIGISSLIHLTEHLIFSLGKVL